MLTRNPGFRRETIKNLDVFSKKNQQGNNGGKDFAMEGGCD